MQLTPISMHPMRRLRTAVLATVALALASPTALSQFEVGRLVGHDIGLCGSTFYGPGVDMDGDTAIVGDLYDSCSASLGGAAYVFRQVGGNWVEESKLVPSDVASQLYFGASVAVQGDRAFIGASSTTTRPGAVYVFRRSGTFPFAVWTEQSKLQAGDATPGDYFGSSVSVSGGTLAVLADNGSPPTSAAYIFGLGGATWTQQQKLTSPAGSRYTFLALSSSTLAARRVALPSYNPVGVDILDRNGGIWSTTTTILSPLPLGAGGFGSSISLDGDTLLVSAPTTDISNVTRAGCFYVYRRSAGVWDAGTRVDPDPPVNDGELGQSVAVQGDRIVAAARYHEPANKATFLAYELLPGSIARIGQMRAKNPDPFSVGFYNNSIAMSGGSFVCGVTYTAVVFSLSPPTPVTYCVAKISSAGCTPSITATGIPSASSSTPFAISASSVINKRFGLLFYGLTGRAAFPFQGGTLCVLPPTKRTLTQESGGSASGVDCSGTYSFDFNPLIQSGTEPGLGAGVYVNAQYWYRDPASPSTTGLTDAIEFGIGF